MSLTNLRSEMKCAMLLIMLAVRWVILNLFIVLLCPASAAEVPAIDPYSLDLPQIGDNRLNCLSPTLLELTLITTKQPDLRRPRNGTSLMETTS